MADSIFQKIDAIEAYATKQEKVIIEHIRSSPVKELILLSITEFAERVHVGDATVLRFCRKLGLKGYSEFRFLLSQSSDEVAPLEESDASRILDDMIGALRATYELIDMDQIRRSAELILKADRVYAFGSGNSGMAAMEFRNKVLRYGIDVVTFSDIHFQLISTSMMKPEDVVVLFSVSGQTKDMINLAKMARSQSVPLIVVTNYLRSPLGK